MRPLKRLCKLNKEVTNELCDNMGVEREQLFKILNREEFKRMVREAVEKEAKNFLGRRSFLEALALGAGITIGSMGLAKGDVLITNDNIIVKDPSTGLDWDLRVPMPFSAIVGIEGKKVRCYDGRGKLIDSGKNDVDDARVIQSGVDVGGRVFIAKGVYNLYKLIELRDNIRIIGEYPDLVCRVSQDSFTKGVFYNIEKRLSNVEIAYLRIWTSDYNTVCIRGVFRDSYFHDLVVNHQIILGHLDPDIISENVKIQHIEMLSGLNYDGSTWNTLPTGHDAGINIKGKNITVDTVWLKPAISSFEGGFVINVKPFSSNYSTNIVLRNLYVEGAIPEIMHIYAYGTGEADVEPVFKVENVYYKMTNAPDYSRFATIAFEVVRSDGLVAEIGEWVFENITVDCSPLPHHFTTVETYDYDTPTRGHIVFRNVRLYGSKGLFVYGHANEIKFENISVKYSDKFAVGRIFSGRSGEHHIYIKNLKIVQGTDSDPYIDGNPDSSSKIYNLYFNKVSIISANNNLILINTGSQDILIREAEQIKFTISGPFKLLKNQDIATIKGDGVTTTFTVDIAHGLVSDKVVARITLDRDGSVDKVYLVDKDGDGFKETLRVQVTYATAPANGETVPIYWEAEVVG